MLKKQQISFDSLTYLSIYPIWTFCSQFKPLLSYISSQIGGKNELVLSGMDNRGYTGYSRLYLYSVLDSFLKTTNIPFIRDFITYPDYLSLLKQAPALVDGKNRQNIKKLIFYTEDILGQLRKQAPKDSFYIKVLEGQAHLFKMALYYKYDSTYIKTRTNYPLHDYQMAENLTWLVSSKYSNQKIIVWAHNTHIEKEAAIGTKDNDYNSMGHYFTLDNSMLNQTYVLGFTAYSGRGKLMLGSNTAEKVTKPNNNSVEAWLHKKGYPYSFVDFGIFNSISKNVEPFYMKSYINKEEKLQWNKYFDGIFFIDKMMPCETIKK